MNDGDDKAKASGKRGGLRPDHVETRLLGDLLPSLAGRDETLPEVHGDVAGCVVCDISLDSRAVTPGSIYAALPGTRAHGADFVADALRCGAVAVLTDREGWRRLQSQTDGGDGLIRDSGVVGEGGTVADAGVPVVVTDNPRQAMAILAAEIFGHPDTLMTTFGVTGTNGKTTTAFMLEAALKSRHRVATIGTLGFRVGGEELHSSRSTITTPESCDLQALLAVMAGRGADVLAMEVSSHALVLERVRPIRFDVAAFTNLGRDHLDFHHTIEDYFEAKARLFDDEYSARQVISIDDPWGAELARRLRKRCANFVTTGFNPQADYRIESYRPTPSGGTEVQLVTPDGPRQCELIMPGKFNARNAATTIAMVASAGLDVDQAIDGLAHACVPGRMQLVQLGSAAPAVYVDFAHTPQAMESALTTAREMCPDGRLISVFGAGGDRDRHKREPMGRVGAMCSDLVIVTDDNPRSEIPEQIRAEVIAGARECPSTTVDVIDGGGRAAAISLALSMAKPGDVVAILGKGHEKGQIIGDTVVPFDDVAEVESAWGRIHREGVCQKYSPAHVQAGEEESR